MHNIIINYDIRTTEYVFLDKIVTKIYNTLGIKQNKNKNIDKIFTEIISLFEFKNSLIKLSDQKKIVCIPKTINCNKITEDYLNKFNFKFKIQERNISVYISNFKFNINEQLSYYIYLLDIAKINKTILGSKKKKETVGNYDTYWPLFRRFITEDFNKKEGIFNEKIYKKKWTDDLKKKATIKLFDGIGFDGNFSTNNHIIKTFKTILKELYNNISLRPYPLETEYQWNKFYNTVDLPRTNHGAWNHLRSIYFTIRLLIECKTSNPERYTELIKDDSYYVILLLFASYFVQLYRIAEGGNNVSGFYDIQQNTVILKNLFPLLDYEFLDAMGKNNSIRLTELVSSIVFMSIMKNINIPKKYNKLIEELGYALMFFADYNYDTHIKDFYGVSLKEFSDSFEVKKNESHKNFLFYYFFINVGHYFEHCRGNWDYPSLLDGPSVISLKIFNMYTDKHLIYFGEIILNTFIKTQFTDNNYDECIKNFKIDTKNSKLWLKCCSNINSLSDWNKYKVSNNFDKAFDKIDLNDYLIKLFT